MSVVAPGLRAEPPAAAPSSLRLLWRRLRRDRLTVAALAVLVALVLVALLAPLLVRLLGLPAPDVRDPAALDAFGAPSGPSRAHPLGVDDFGRDVLSRALYGARVSLLVGLGGTAAAVGLGVAVGLVAGWVRGWVDTLLAGLIDAMLAFPALLLGVGVAAACSVGDGCLGGAVRPGLPTVLLVAAAVNWTIVARVVRGQVVSLREREFVAAARVAGMPERTILVREIAPNLVAPVLVCATLLVPQTILLEAALSFLGVGVTAATPSWGAMLAAAAPNFDTQWWYMLVPGTALLVTVLAFNVLADGVQEALASA